jgi:hypothetical protein
MSNKADWDDYAVVLGRAGEEKTYATGDRCLKHGKLFAEMFCDVMGWEDFCSKCQSNIKFKNLVDAAGENDNDEEVDGSSNHVNLRTDTQCYIETYNDAEILSEEALKTKLGVKKLPPNMKSVPELRIPVLKEGENGLGVLEFETRYAFGSATGESQSARIVMRHGVNLESSSFAGAAKFSGYGDARFAKMTADIAASTNWKALTKTSLEPLQSFLERKGALETPQRGAGRTARSLDFYGTASGSVAAVASVRARESGDFEEIADDDADEEDSRSLGPGDERANAAGDARSLLNGDHEQLDEFASGGGSSSARRQAVDASCAASCAGSGIDDDDDLDLPGALFVWVLFVQRQGNT